jgi:3-oxoacyl-[acyl-carrier-protein] synthase II
VFVVGYAAATPLGRTFSETWRRAARGESGLGPLTRFETGERPPIVGEIPDFDGSEYDFISEKDRAQWDARNVLLTAAVCSDALSHAGLLMDAATAPRTGCLIGASVHGADSLRTASKQMQQQRPLAVSPWLLPNLCANVASARAAMQLGFAGPLLSPQAACATGNYAIALGARLVRGGDCDFVLAGGVESPLVPEIVQGFANMGASLKVRTGDRAYDDPAAASRPFSKDRKGFVLSEGAGVVVLAAEDALHARGLTPLAEVLGVGWTSDAHHFAAPHAPAVVRSIVEALSDAGVRTDDVGMINAHGTSTMKGDAVEIACLREVFGDQLAKVPIVANKSQLGHTQSACGAIEAALTIEGMRQSIMLPTLNYQADPSLGELDVVAGQARTRAYAVALSTALGFGGTNCSLVFKGV